MTLLDTDEVVEIYANLKTTVDIIHVDDWVRDDEKASKALRRSQETSMGKAILSVSIYFVTKLILCLNFAVSITLKDILLNLIHIC